MKYGQSCISALGPTPGVSADEFKRSSLNLPGGTLEFKRLYS